MNVYDDVYGFEQHTVRGYKSNHHVLFHHFGHNIVVGRLVVGQSTSPPQNLKSTLRSAYWPHCILYGIPGHLTCAIHAGKTVKSTWNQLRNRGLNPVMLHIIQYGIDIKCAHYFDERYLVSKISLPGTTVTLIATN